MSDTPSQTRRPIPPYMSYPSFYRAMRYLRESGLPRKVESKTLARMNYDAPRIVAGFLALGLIDELGFPSLLLKKMVSTFSTSEWQGTIRELIRTAYAFVPENLEDTSSRQINEYFVSYVGRDIDAVRSAATFFLCLAEDAGLSLSSSLAYRSGRGLRDAKRVLLTEPEDHEHNGDAVQLDVKASEENRRSATSPGQNERKRSEVMMEQILLLANEMALGKMTEQERQAAAQLMPYFAREVNRA